MGGVVLLELFFFFYDDDIHKTLITELKTKIKNKI